ncbi:MAG TPA: hypothetical protein VI547_14075 [Anaerolineales bacterium]|nr:hypothetical protein [Anaerolineales bacterium]
MRLVTNDSLVKRNATIGKYAMGAGFLILIGGLLVNLNSLNNNNPALQSIPFVSLIVGFILTNIGTHMTNRYGREPRADKTLDGALKGFDDRYHLYNFYLPAPHFLVAPNGLFALVPKFQHGLVRWDGKRWSHKNASFFRSFFGQDNLANPNAEAAADAEAIAKYLAKKIGGDLPPVQAIIVFYHPNVTIEAENPPIPAVHVKQLKEHLRKLGKPATQAKEGAGGGAGKRTLTPEQISRLDEVLGI